jgi:hypothetical protein
MATVYVNSVCNAASLYVQSVSDGAPNAAAADLARNAFGLAAQLFPDPTFRDALSKLTPQVAIRAFSTGPEATPVFAPELQLSAEGVSFFYIVALSVPGFLKFVGEERYSNSFLFSLLNITYQAGENAGFPHLQTLVLSSILLLVSDPVAASGLTESRSQRGQNRIRVTASLGELVCRQLFTVYSHEQFVPSVISFLQMIAPHASSFSLDVASKALDLFARVSADHPELVSLILECLAAMVQQDAEGHNYFLVAIVQHSKWLRSLKAPDERAAAALRIVDEFVKSGKAAIKASKEQKLTGLELLTLLQGARATGGEKIVIRNHPPVFGGELEETWKVWTAILFTNAAAEEVRAFRAFQVEYEPKLAEVLAKVNN